MFQTYIQINFVNRQVGFRCYSYIYTWFNFDHNIGFWDKRQLLENGDHNIDP
jgi:hypothetical protein